MIVAAMVCAMLIRPVATTLAWVIAPVCVVQTWRLRHLFYCSDELRLQTRAMFRYSFLVLKIYNIRYALYRFSVLAVNIGTALVSDCCVARFRSVFRACAAWRWREHHWLRSAEKAA